MNNESLSPEMSMMVPPEYIGGVFKTGRYGKAAETLWKDIIPTYDVLDETSRRAWCFENMRVFSDGTLPSPEMQWKGVVDHWLSDLKLSTIRAKATKEDQHKIKEGTEMDIKAMMAVSASARAMEQSGGSASKYVAIITHSEQGDLDKQDAWSEFLLHDDGHGDKLARVIGDPLVKRYYIKLLRDAGYDSGQLDAFEKAEKVRYKHKSKETQEEKEEVVIKDLSVDHMSDVDAEAIRDGSPSDDKLVDFLRRKKPKKDNEPEFTYKGGFNSYIEKLLAGDSEDFILEKMDENIDDSGRWAAAKLACDAFLVDKYTDWEYRIDPNGNLQLNPFPGWGGDPLRAVLEPSFLPRKIKKVYSDEDKAVLDLTDEAFRPSDVFGLPGKKAPLSDEVLPASMVGHLKHYARFNEALSRFVGGSRAGGIPQWTDKTMGEDLPQIAELLDQVYGVRVTDGKHVVGAMMMRILEAKALALVSESHRPGFGDYTKILFGPKEISRPFLKIEQFLWGQDLDIKDGFLVSLTAGRTRIVLKDNMYHAEENIKNIWELLSTNDQDPQTRGRATALRATRLILESAKAVSKGFGLSK